MVRFKELVARRISERRAQQMRLGIALGVVVINFYTKGDLVSARRVLVKGSRASKYTYLSMIHTVANHLKLQ